MRFALAAALLVPALLPGQPQVIQFIAQPSSVIEGEKVTLRWNVKAAATISISPDVGAHSETRGTATVFPSRTTIYVLTARDKQGRESSTSVEVQVVPSAPKATVGEMGLSRLTGRTFLLPGELPESGYGLYSYVLLGEKATASNLSLYLAVIEAVLSRMHDMDELRKRTSDLKRLNLLSIPVNKPIELNQAETITGQAALVLKNYDYATAQVLLAAIPKGLTAGPYLFSHFEPIRPERAVSQPYLLQNLSRRSPKLAQAWVSYFQDLCAKPQPWREPALKKIALSLRDYLQKLGDEMPAAAASVIWLGR
ncbi:MAG: hypothetical protein WD696_07610 [Bryobacteraceae bacterium]